MKPTYEQIQRILETIAQQEGLSAEEVARSIDESIADAYYTALQEKNHQALARFSQIPRSGTLPNAFELIAYMAEYVQYEMHGN